MPKRGRRQRILDEYEGFYPPVHRGVDGPTNNLCSTLLPSPHFAVSTFRLLNSHDWVESCLMLITFSGQMSGFVVGLVPWLKSLIIGNGAPLKVIQDSLQLMG
jgi:hypothetical protein